MDSWHQRTGKEFLSRKIDFLNDLHGSYKPKEEDAEGSDHCYFSLSLAMANGSNKLKNTF